jgi:hypothetical protein
LVVKDPKTKWLYQHHQSLNNSSNAMNQQSSTYKLIASHNKDIQVSLYTPAHQGIAPRALTLYSIIHSVFSREQGEKKL